MHPIIRLSSMSNDLSDILSDKPFFAVFPMLDRGDLLYPNLLPVAYKLKKIDITSVTTQKVTQKLFSFEFYPSARYKDAAPVSTTATPFK